MAHCSCSNPPWELRDEDNYCSDCARKLKRFSISPVALNLRVSDGFARESVTLRNEAVAPDERDPLTPVAVQGIQLECAGGRLELLDQDERSVSVADTLDIRPRDSRRIDLVYSGEASAGADFYCRLSGTTSDWAVPRFEVRVAVSSKSPEVKWLDESGRPIPEEGFVAEFSMTTGSVAETSRVSRSVKARNDGGGYLIFEGVQVPAESQSYLEVSGFTEPVRHGQSGPIEIRLKLDSLPKEGFQAVVPLTFQFRDLPEQVVKVLIQIRARAELGVDLPRFRREGNRESDLRFILGCTPYARQDFEMRLFNRGGEPLNIVELQFDHPDVVRVYKGGYMPRGPGRIDSETLQPGESSTAFKLNLDLTRLEFGKTHVVKLRFVTDPDDAGCSVDLVLQVKRKEFGSLTQPSYIGIDFGTSNSAVATRLMHNVRTPEDQFCLLPIREEQAREGLDPHFIPSVLYFRDVDDPVVGDLAEAIADAGSDRFFRSFKRAIGFRCPRYVLGRFFSPQDMAEIIFRRLVEKATETLPYFSPLVVATCPANFLDVQKTSIKRACRRALLKMTLHIHADDLKRELEGSFPFGRDLTALLREEPSSLEVLRLVIRDAEARQPRFRWDLTNPPDCLLLLGYLTAHRRVFFPQDDNPADPPLGRWLSRGDVPMALVYALLEARDTQGRSEFRCPPNSFRDSPGEVDLEGLLDQVEEWVTEVLASAGLMDVQLLDEPTAAGYAFVLRNRQRFVDMENGKHEYVAVYDFGGGTFDISVLRVVRRKGVGDGAIDSIDVEVIQSDGINQMGGDDLDFELIKHYVGRAAPEKRFRPLLTCNIHELPRLISRWGQSEQQSRLLTAAVRDVKVNLKRSAEADKINLSEDTSPNPEREAHFPRHELIQCSGDRSVTITRDKFYSLIGDKIEQTVSKFVDVLERAEVSESQAGRQFDLKRIILVGMTSKLPMIREKLLAQPKLPITPDMFDESLKGMEKGCVAVGAVYFASLLRAGTEGGVQVESKARVLSHSVGLIKTESLAQQWFEPLEGLVKGTRVEGPSGIAEATYEIPYSQTGGVFIAQSTGVKRSKYPHPDIHYVGRFAWNRVIEEPTGRDRIKLIVRVDADGLTSIEGWLRGSQLGTLRRIPEGHVEDRFFVFV